MMPRLIDLSDLTNHWFWWKWCPVFSQFKIFIFYKLIKWYYSTRTKPMLKLEKNRWAVSAPSQCQRKDHSIVLVAFLCNTHSASLDQHSSVMLSVPIAVARCSEVGRKCIPLLDFSMSKNGLFHRHNKYQSNWTVFKVVIKLFRWLVLPFCLHSPIQIGETGLRSLATPQTSISVSAQHK